MNNRKNDMFADIAAAGIDSSGKNLAEPKPPVLPARYLEGKGVDKEAAFLWQDPVCDKESLYKEVERQKAFYRPFFRDLAPALESVRKKREIHDFRWRRVSLADYQDFTGMLNGERKWEDVTVPHFGEPRGVEMTCYTTVVNISREERKEESLWICFRGVDYKAHVFWNGMYLGSHEGFFAPFEFAFTRQAREGENILTVLVENDYIHMGSCSERGGEMFTGDKFYAATGPGYDEPYEGWHHCPPGMGIYQDVYLETRSSLFVQDCFVRPIVEEEKAEVWLELYGTLVGHREITVDLSVYGQNFEETVTEHFLYQPSTNMTVGMGDSLTEAKMKAEGKLGAGILLQMERGINYLRIPVAVPGARRWNPESPWLYQVQLRILDGDGQCLDTCRKQFGMRSFLLDEKSVPKGKFYLNGKQIRLRGANTMGHEQQCVMKKDWEQLFTDCILAKVCHMNFLRLTQRPVQEEVYDCCDKMGLMLQTDLPLFAVLRRNQFAEGIRQVQEMEHFIRSHPSAILISYINEPMPNARNMPHRGLTRPELEDFFSCADLAVRILNPDRAIKHVDGDYDPPTAGYPDNHCYPCWYNGHGIDIGRLHKGYWMRVKPGWHYGCGEFGIEGLEEVSVMRKYYPEGWLPETPAEEKEWSPLSIPGAQTGNFHRFFYDTQNTLEGWVKESQRHQADSVTLMTCAYRRDSRMNSFAYHLFIDAFPDGWMKTLMDVDRNPKKAFFAYRDALTPLMVNIRTDRFQAFAGEKIPAEIWICNDTGEAPADMWIHYQIRYQGNLLCARRVKADIPVCDSRFQGFVEIPVPEAAKRGDCTLQAALADGEGHFVHGTQFTLPVFPREERYGRVCPLGNRDHGWESMAEDMGWQEITLGQVTAGDTIFVLNFKEYKEKEKQILALTEAGAWLVFLELPQGEYRILESRVQVRDCSMLPLHFVSRDTGHEWVKEFGPRDFQYWYDEKAGYITPLLDSTFTAEDFRAVLTSGNQEAEGCWQKVLAAGERDMGRGKIVICQVKLAGRTHHNPAAERFAAKLILGR